MKTILAAGLLAGALDLAYLFAFLAIKYPPLNAPRVLQGIAAGAIGRDAATDGGWGTATLGLALHFVIALSAAAVFYVASRRLRFLSEGWWITGPVYGVAVWLVMNLVVLPLSATPPKAFPPPAWAWIFAAHVLCVGLPIAWVVRRHPRCVQCDREKCRQAARICSTLHFPARRSCFADKRNPPRSPA